MDRSLENKVWYRVLKVLAVLVLVAAFFTPLLTGPNTNWILDGFINVLVWVVIALIGRQVLIYVVYGKRQTVPTQVRELTSEEREKYQRSMRRMNRLLFWILVGGPLILCGFGIGIILLAQGLS